MILEILRELDRATTKFPTWPTDPLHAVAVLAEETGELQKAVLQAVYEPGKSGPTQVRNEAVQVAAMAIRFLISMEAYEYCRSQEHVQPIGCAACDRGDVSMGHSINCPNADKHRKPR